MKKFHLCFSKFICTRLTLFQHSKLILTFSFSSLSLGGEKVIKNFSLNLLKIIHNNTFLFSYSMATCNLCEFFVAIFFPYFYLHIFLKILLSYCHTNNVHQKFWFQIFNTTRKQFNRGPKSVLMRVIREWSPKKILYFLSSFIQTPETFRSFQNLRSLPKNNV